MDFREFSLQCPTCRTLFQVRTRKRRARRARCPCGEVFDIELPSNGKRQLTLRKRAANSDAILSELPAGDEQIDSAVLLVVFAFVTIVGVILSAVTWFLGFELFARIIFYATVLVLLLLFLFVLFEVARETKNRLVVSGPINGQTLRRAIIWWLPVFMILAPGLVLTLTIDRVLDGAIQHAEVYTHSTLAAGSDALAQRIANLEKRTYRWWWPPDYPRRKFDGAILNTLKSIRIDAIPNASLFARTIFAFVYAVMRVIQVVSFAVIFFLLVRSYLHILGRYWLWQVGEVRFRPVTN